MKELKTVIVDLDAIEARNTAANDMVRRLCLRRDDPNSREWVMSIPAQPNRDPDLVVGYSLHDVPALVAEVRRLRTLFLDLSKASDECDPTDKLDPDGDAHTFRRAVEQIIHKARNRVNNEITP